MLAESEILNASILIVDDQESNVILLEQLLSEAGYTAVTSTMNPLEVCALHRKHRYDLILLDLQMPGMDGFQVIEGLKTNDVDAYLPVLVITAQPAHKLRALQAGARDFVSKPFDLIEVRTRIRNMLEARFRSLTELASDWYWEQDESGSFTRVSGPVQEMLGIQVDSLVGQPGDLRTPGRTSGWNEAERAMLQSMIAARQPFLDFNFSRTNGDGTRQKFQVSGEPMFNQACRFVGYRGIGVELTSHK